MPAMNAPTDLQPRIPDGATRRFLGGAALILGLLMIFSGRPLENLGTMLFNLGAALLIWGSVLGWLRVLEDRQIAVQRRLLGLDREPPATS